MAECADCAKEETDSDDVQKNPKNKQAQQEPAASGSTSEEEAHVAAHVARLTQHSVELIEERVDALEHHKLAPAPVDKRPTKPLRAMLRNSWVLLLMAGVLGIIVAAKGRIHVEEPLAGVHATSGIVPFVSPLDTASIDYLFINLLIAPYFPPDAPGSSGSSNHRRRLVEWVGEAVSLRASGDEASGMIGELQATGGVAGGLVAAEARAEMVRNVRQLLARPKFTVAQRRRQHRRLLADGLSEEPPSEVPASELPQLKITLMQRNASANATALDPVSGLETLAEGQQPGLVFIPVSEPQYCSTKEGAAVKCSLSFRGGDLTAAAVPGEPLYLGFEATEVTQIVFKSQVSELGALGPAKNWLALAIVILVLLAIASERIHRMWAAFIGAALMMGLLLLCKMAPSLALVVEWLDESTLGLLFGMMIIVGRLADTGVFELLSAAAVRRCRGRMWLLSVMLMVITAVISAFLDNVTAMLLLVPVSISVARACNADPVPLLMAQVLMSNIGGTATMVGDPPALIIGTALSNYIGFVDFLIHMAPGAILAAAACIPLLLLIYRRSLVGRIDGYGKVVEEVKAYRIKDWDLMAKSGYVTGLVLLGFLLHPVHHVDPAWFAVLGAVVLCVCDRPMEVEKVIHSVEWDMLLFFASMFVMIEASAEIGLIDMIGQALSSVIRGAPESSRLIVAIQILLWLSAVISGVLDNIPYTIVMVPVIEYLAGAGLGLDLPTLAWALDFGACFGGNATLIGASANIVTATLAERAGCKITFVSWLRSGIPITLVSVAVADVYMLLRYCL